MVHDPIAEWRSADFALLGCMNVEVQIGAMLVAMAVQGILEFQQVIRQLMLDGGPVQATLATRGFAVGFQQIVPGNDVSKA